MPKSYLDPDFDPDVFVSYSHGDPIGGRAPLRDWTRALIRKLEDQLHSLETEFDKLRLWMDPLIDPTAKLTEELRAKASASGVLMIVMSNRYLKSSWCKDELEWFRKQVEARPGESGRVFVLRAQKTDTTLWPEFFRDERGNVMTGFSFYDPETGFPWDYPDLNEPNAEFRMELVRLQTWLVARLRELRQRADKAARENAAGSTAPKTTGPRLIYLHALPDSDSERAEVDAALKTDGIVPLTTSSRGGAGLAAWQRESAERINMARNCEALTLLRAGDPGRFAGDLVGIGINERKEMSGARGAPLPCAVLDKTGESLPIDVAPFGIERFDVNQTDWRGRFRSWLDASRSAPAGAAP